MTDETRDSDAQHSEYVRKLVRENQALESSKADLERDVGRLVAEKTALDEQISSLRSQLSRFENEQRVLGEKLAKVRAEWRQCSSRYVEVEEQNNHLANLYVASYRLHESLDKEELLKVLQEIIINLIGSEEFAIFERSPAGDSLDLVASFGVDQKRLKSLDLGSGPVAETVRTGEMYLAESVPDEDPAARRDQLIACIPLRVADRVHGVVAIFGLLVQKKELEPLDYELFDLLASHAGASLHLSSIAGGGDSRG